MRAGIVFFCVGGKWAGDLESGCIPIPAELAFCMRGLVFVREGDGPASLESGCSPIPAELAAVAVASVETK